MMNDFKIGDVGVYRSKVDFSSKQNEKDYYKLRTRFVYGKVVSNEKEQEVKYFYPFRTLDSYYRHLKRQDEGVELPSAPVDSWSHDSYFLEDFVKIPASFWLDDERVAAFLRLQGLGEEFGLE